MLSLRFIIPLWDPSKMRRVMSSPFVLGKYFKSHTVKENLGIFGITALSFSLPLDLSGNSDKLVKIEE